MKHTITHLSLLCLLFISSSLSSQNWVWMHGTDTLNLNAMYGTMNVANTTNRPGSLSASAFWTDQSGAFWMFGGFGNFGASQDFGSDLWKFDVATNSWKRVRGAGASNTATYGTLNVANSSNAPGGRSNAATWADNSGNLWMFGGFGVTTSTTQGYLNDLWKYNISADQWTWMGGSNFLNQFGQYGTLGVPSTTNIPGARAYSCAWIVNNYAYIYGGSGCSSNTTSGYLGDLWRFDMTNGQWVWLKGSNTNYLAANHGTQGFSSAANTPGSRSSALCWKDNSNNIWLGSGLGVYSGFGTCTWGDLWSYNATTNNWTWIKGSNVPYTSPLGGTQGVATSTSDPGARTSSATWVDNNGDFWLFGGDAFYQANLGDYSDLWKYSMTSNQWTWMKGPSAEFQPGVYGSKYYPASTNNPPYRKYAAAWKDNSGNFWLHGGASINPSVTPTNRGYADMWKLNTCTTVPTAPAGIAVSSNSACGGSAITFSSTLSANYLFWKNVATGSVVGTGAVYSLTLPSGIYSITAISVNNCDLSINNPVTTVTMFANPTISVTSANLCLGSTFTLNPSGAASYTYSSGSNTVAPLSTTSYSIVGANAQGCLSTNTAVCTLTIIPSPTVTVNSGSLCAGLTFSMNPSGATTYSYSSGGSIVMNIQSNGVYTVTGAFPNGCRDTALAFLTVYQLPIITVPSGTICRGQNFTFNPSGAATYTFLSGSAIVSPSVTSSFSVTGTSSVGCVSALPGVGNVTVFANPNIAIAAESNTVCNGELRTFTATGGTYYTWGGGQNTPQVSLTFALGSTTLFVAGIDANGCANTSSLALLITNCTGVKEESRTQLVKLFPNPFSETIKIESTADVQLRIVDVMGKVILDQKLNQGSNDINLTGQAAGIYFAEIIVGEQHQTIKLQKLN